MLRYAKPKISGFVLVFVLLFMQIFALLALYAIDHALLAEKMSHHIYQHYLLLNRAEAGLKYAESHDLICEIPVMDSQELVKKPLIFWQSLSCGGIFPGFQYYYVSELLGKDFCADIQGENATAAYFRITLLAINNNAKIMLQSVVIKPAAVTKECQGSRRTVTAGRQMWRMLEST